MPGASRRISLCELRARVSRLPSHGDFYRPPYSYEIAKLAWLNPHRAPKQKWHPAQRTTDTHSSATGKLTCMFDTPYGPWAPLHADAGQA